MRPITGLLALFALLGPALSSPLHPSGDGSDGSSVVFTEQFGLHRRSKLTPWGRNPFFPVQAGATTVLEGEDDGAAIVVHREVLAETRSIRLHVEGGSLGVQAAIIEERVFVKDELREVTHQYVATCRDTCNVYLLGEVTLVSDTGAAAVGESWVAGQNGAEPGLIMPGSFLLGARYCISQAPEISEDRATNLAMNGTIEIGGQAIEGCAIVLETSALDPTEQVIKVYAPGEGLVQDGDLFVVPNKE